MDYGEFIEPDDMSLLPFAIDPDIPTCPNELVETIQDVLDDDEQVQFVELLADRVCIDLGDWATVEIFATGAMQVKFDTFLKDEHGMDWVGRVAYGMLDVHSFNELLRLIRERQTVPE
jgi:hypothetical protein